MNAYPIDNLWRKGHYMQRLEQGGRDFVSGKPIKSRGVVEVTAKDIGTLPAWILRTSSPHACGECGRPKPVTELIAAFPEGWTVVGEGYDRNALTAISDLAVTREAIMVDAAIGAAALVHAAQYGPDTEPF